MANLDLYEKVREVPKEAQKPISAGRLKGMTDINPMWRIKVLTEQFGVCGIGWYPEIVRSWLEPGANGEITANMEIKLYIKDGNEWSKGIPGVGGSKFVAKETNGLYTDDECYKKAYTDAVSVACKALGIGANVYFAKDTTKYDDTTNEGTSEKNKSKKFNPLTKTELVQVWKVESPEETIAWFEKRFGKPYKEWGEEETEAARAKLEERNLKRESEARELEETETPFPMK